MLYFIRLRTATILKFCVRLRPKICNQTLASEVVSHHHRFNEEQYRAKQHGKLTGINAGVCPNTGTYFILSGNYNHSSFRQFRVTAGSAAFAVSHSVSPWVGIYALKFHVLQWISVIYCPYSKKILGMFPRARTHARTHTAWWPYLPCQERKVG